MPWSDLGLGCAQPQHNVCAMCETLSSASDLYPQVTHAYRNACSTLLGLMTWLMTCITQASDYQIISAECVSYVKYVHCYAADS